MISQSDFFKRLKKFWDSMNDEEELEDFSDRQLIIILATLCIYAVLVYLVVLFI